MGIFTVPVKLATGIEAEIKVWVSAEVSEEDEVSEAAAEESEAEANADGLEVATQRRDHLWQPVGADMRTRVGEDRRRGTVRGQDREYVAHRAALVGPRVELAIAVGARAALTKAVVAIDVYFAPLVERRQVAGECRRVA